MPFIELGNEFGSTREPIVAPEGREYDLVVRDVSEHRKDGKLSYRCDINIEGEDDEYQTIFHYLAMPNAALDQRNDEERGHKPGTTTRSKMLMLKRFLVAFNVPFTDTGFNPADITGARARMPLKQEVYEGRRSNRLALPELPDTVTNGQAGEAVAGEKKKSK